MSRGSPRNGFSLVELSIVLVILGLLTGGILAGQSLIRAAELRSVTTEYHRWITATRTFRDQYMAIPGDMNNATRFWGDDNAACPDAAIPDGSPGTCNGNGSGTMSWASAAGDTGEVFQFWKQLALAGLIEGSYTGLAGPGGGVHHVSGGNAPPSKLSNAMWGIWYTAPNFGGSTAEYAVDFGNCFVFGGQGATGHNNGLVLKPEEAWNIDSKIDDGRPGTGSVIAYQWNNICANATANTDFASSYRVSETTFLCSLRFRKAF